MPLHSAQRSDGPQRPSWKDGSRSGAENMLAYESPRRLNIVHNRTHDHEESGLTIPRQDSDD